MVFQQHPFINNFSSSYVLDNHYFRFEARIYNYCWQNNFVFVGSIYKLSLGCFVNFVLAWKNKNGTKRHCDNKELKKFLIPIIA